jgi:hypothetical protein
MDMWKRVLLAIVIGWGGYQWWDHRPVPYGPGVAAVHVPVQQSVSDAHPFSFKGYRVTPLARFTMEARVLAREDYRIGRESELSPIDFVFGWGRMSDGAVLDQINIRQSNRFYYWNVKEFPIPRHEIETSSANMHLIPADNAIERSLDKVRRGQVVQLRGYLVRVDANDGWSWASSLSRNDTGAGACELIYVEDVIIL